MKTFRCLHVFRARRSVFFICAAISSRGLAAPGDLDTGFGTGGVFTTSFASNDDYGYSVAVQTDGKVLVAGGSAGGDYAILRLLPNGSPDPDFGSGGKVIHKFGSSELARGVAAVSGGRILVGGSGVVGGVIRDFAVMRLLANGALDPDYATDGIVTTDISGTFNEHVHCMAVDSSERAILAGYYRTNFALVRYTASGAPDPSFGAGGKVFTAGSTGTEQQVNAVALQGDGKIVVAGFSRTDGNTDFIVARYLENGTPDSDFGTGGKTTTAIRPGDVMDVANSVAVLPDGKILAAGTSANDYAMARYTSEAVLDTAFGSGGGYYIDYGGAVDAGYGLAVQSDGKILLAGTSHLNGRDYFALLRFTSGGTIDTGFGSGGALLTAVTPGSDSARAITLQSDGKILVAGWAGAVNANDFAVARYESASPIPIEAWRQSYFGKTANTGNSANDFDFDKDGLVNLLEYAFGQDPTLGSSRQIPSGQVSGGNFVGSFTAPSSVTGVTYAAEWSPTLAAGTWSPVTDAGSGRQHIFSVPMSGRPRLCLRWKVTPQ